MRHFINRRRHCDDRFSHQSSSLKIAGIVGWLKAIRKPCNLGTTGLFLIGLLILTGNVRADDDPAGPATTPAEPSSSSTTTTKAAQPPLPVPPVPAAFKHPGLLNSMEELQFIKKKIAAGEEPWKSAFEQMKATKFAALNYKPHPHEQVSSGILGAGGAAGGAFDENDDAIAAYTQALMWIFTDNEQYAQNAVQILNAWSILQGHGGPSWYLSPAWLASAWTEGAELIKSTYPKWSADDIAKFSAMLDRAFLPELHNQMAYGNRELAVCNALISIGVFNNDRAAFAEGLAHWVSYVPCWIYLTSDGPTPRKPDYWLTSPSDDDLAKMDAGLLPDVKQSWIYSDQTTLTYDIKKKMGNDHTMLEGGDPGVLWYHAPASAYVDGLCSETFRDLGHCDLGLAQMINVAEIARHQGIDLYGMDSKRITAFLEFESFLRTGDLIPKEFYSVQSTGTYATFEIAYNHYHNLMGMDLPKTGALVQQFIRPCIKKVPTVSVGWCSMQPDIGIRANQIAGPVDLDINWETLTHGELDAKGK